MFLFLFFFSFITVCHVVKTRKEAKRMAIMDSISAKNARVEELKRSVQLLMAKRDQYATVVSQQSLGIFLSSFYSFVSYVYALSNVCV